MSIFHRHDKAHEVALVLKRGKNSSMESRGDETTAPIDVSHVPSGAPATVPDTHPVSGAPSYTVVAGDSLWKIATRQLGDGRKWNTIYKANKDKIKDPDVIHPGQILKLPQA